MDKMMRREAMVERNGVLVATGSTLRGRVQG